MYGSIFSILYTTEEPIVIDVGFNFQNERQDVTVSNYLSITGGSFTLTYTDINGNHNFTVAWNANINTWAANFQTAIQAMPFLQDVTVSPVVDVLNVKVTFQVNFAGSAGKRNYDILTVNSNNLINIADPSFAYANVYASTFKGNVISNNIFINYNLEYKYLLGYGNTVSSLVIDGFELLDENNNLIYIPLKL